MRKPVTTLALSCLALTAFAGCGTTTIDADKAEKEITSLVETQVDAKVKSVSCPEDKEAKQGESFTCEVTGTDATTGQALVTMKDDEGNVRVSAPFVHPRDVETKIAEGIKEQTDFATVTVSCPEIIVGKAGGTLECEADGDGNKAAVTVTQTDGKGGFDYKVQNTGGG